jgi:hypothetical protein
MTMFFFLYNLSWIASALPNRQGFGAELLCDFAGASGGGDGSKDFVLEAWIPSRTCGNGRASPGDCAFVLGLLGRTSLVTAKPAAANP